MTSSYESFGRINQKRRTRAALKEAAAEFVRRGVTPTVAQVAEAALVSKSTAYRYFPSQEALSPLEGQLGTERLQRLVMALSMCVGMESIMVMEDICGLTPAEAETIKRWAAGALLQASLSELATAEGRTDRVDVGPGNPG